MCMCVYTHTKFLAAVQYGVFVCEEALFEKGSAILN